MVEVAKKWGENQQSEKKVTCSLVTTPVLYVEIKAKQKISLLMEEYTSREWLAYLIGSISERGNYFIEDISIPPHKESAYASAEAEPFHIPKEDCIGVIHSHHGMGAFHSGTDLSHVDRNFPVSITVARGEGTNLKYSAVSITETPCHQPISLECEVKYIQPEPDFDAEEWLKESKVDIDKGQAIANKYNYGNYYTQGNLLGNKPGDKGMANTYPETVLPTTPQRNVIITNEMVRKVRKAVQEDRGILLTRSQIEEMLEKNPMLCTEMGES